MKKWTRRVFYGVLIIVLGGLLADQGLHILSRTEWFKERVSNALHQTLGRETQLARMGANLRGVFLEDLQIAQKGGFEQGIFAQIGRLQVRISLINLLRGQIKIHGFVVSDMRVKLEVFADGTTSWQDWTSTRADESATPEDAQPFSLPLTATQVRLENVHVVFVDHRVAHTLEIKGLNLEVKNFSFQQEFPLSLWMKFYHTQTAFEQGLMLVLQARVHLNDLELEKAYIQVETLKALYEKSSLALQGRIENLVSPRANLILKAKNISSDLLKGLVDLPRFDLPKLAGELTGNLNTKQQTFTLDRAQVQAPGLVVNTKGRVDYAGKTRYEFSGEATGIFGEMGRWFVALADPYRLVGTTKLIYTLSQEKMTAQLELQDMGALLPQAGQLSNLTGTLQGWEQMNFKAGHMQTQLAGKFQGSPFTLALNFEQTPQKMLADLKAHAKELRWQVLQAKAPEATQAASHPVEQSSGKTADWAIPLDLKADIDVEKLDVPYFYGTQVMFDADVQGFTPALTKTHGMLRLRTENGKIQDIYKLTNANPLTKVLFMSLNLTGKVFNSLNVLGVLRSVSGGVASVMSGGDKESAGPVKTQTVLGPDGEPLEIVIVDEAQKIEGEMPYDKFDTQVDFVSGKATVKEGTFVAPMMSLRLDGTTDFNTGIVDLTVHAAPGRHEVDGMLPLTLKIGGTVDEPTGNMQMLGSMASLVTQTITNNVVSRNVTKGVKGFFGLFKKKEKPLPEQPVSESLPQE